MSADELEMVLQAFTRRRPLRSFTVEFLSGDRVLVAHPEAIRRTAEVFVYRGRDRVNRVFAAQAVGQLIDQTIDSSST